MTYPHEITGDAQALANGKLWNLVSKTDTRHVKEVRKGARRFSAIDAYSQIKRATEVFGPVGQGWGWTIKDIKFWGEGVPENHSNLCVVHITLWWKPSWNEEKPNENNPFSESEPNEYDAVGVNIISRKPKDKDYVSLDDDCVKKALTDAITKGLSYLGFNSDVFFGAFDDNKYVADLAREQAEAAQPPAQQRPQATQATQPAQAQAGPEMRADGKPAWFDELVGGEGKFKDRNWEWITGGGPDGGRHSWLRAVYAKYRSPMLLKRVAWILSKFYDDQEAKDGTLKSGAQQAPEPDQGWQPSADEG